MSQKCRYCRWFNPEGINIWFPDYKDACMHPNFQSDKPFEIVYKKEDPNNSCEYFTLDPMLEGSKCLKCIHHIEEKDLTHLKGHFWCDYFNEMSDSTHPSMCSGYESESEDSDA